MLNKAYELARKEHLGQVDKGGNPYINHPISVANLMSTDDEKIVAYLHDIVEDTKITLSSLYEMGFTDEIVFAIDSMTKRDNENYDDYIKRLCKSPLAIRVKIADMTHNSDITRIAVPVQKDYDRVKNYQIKIKQLKVMLKAY